MSGHRPSLNHLEVHQWEIRDNPKPDYFVEWHGLRDLAYFRVGKAKFAENTGTLMPCDFPIMSENLGFYSKSAYWKFVLKSIWK